MSVFSSMGTPGEGAKAENDAGMFKVSVGFRTKAMTDTTSV